MPWNLILGRRGSEYGLWQAKPGKDVLTAPPRDLSYNMGDQVASVIAAGVVNVTQGTPALINIQNVGYYPRVLLIVDPAQPLIDSTFAIPGPHESIVYDWPLMTRLRIRNQFAGTIKVTYYIFSDEAPA